MIRKLNYQAGVLALSFAFLASGCHDSRTAHADSVPNVPGSVPGVQLVSPPANGQWTIPAGDYGHTRFSTLDQINTQNVGKLRLITSMATGIPHGHEGGPLVVKDTMYVITPFPNNLIAIDLKNPTGPTKWIYQPHPSMRAEGVACCDVVNRGGSYGDGKIVYATLDDNVVAVNAETGKEEWRTPVGDTNIGETITMAPLIVKNHVFVGNSGGELGVRGKEICLDLATGKQVWVAYHTGPDKDVLIGPDFKAFYRKTKARIWASALGRPINGRSAGALSGVGFPTTPNSISSFMAPAILESGMPISGPATTSGRSRFGRAIRTRDTPSGPTRWKDMTLGTMTKLWKTSRSTWIGAGACVNCYCIPHATGSCSCSIAKPANFSPRSLSCPSIGPKVMI